MGKGKSSKAQGIQSGFRLLNDSGFWKKVTAQRNGFSS
jgi:hypothetical protein